MREMLKEFSEQSQYFGFVISVAAYLFGCWHGMFDLKRQDWGGGNRSEGGAASIYTGWTNAPLAWAVAGRILGKSIENFTHAGRKGA